MKGDSILVIDDDPKIIDSIKLAFDEYRIIGVSSGAQALNVIREPNDIELVILDVKLADSCGTVVLAEIKKLQPDLAVIIVTGYSSGHVLVQSLRGHADDYLEKPFDLTELRGKVEKLLEAKSHHTMYVKPGSHLGVGRVARLLEKNHDKHVGLREAAEIVALSPKYLSRVFKKQIGQSFTEYRLSVKVQMAKKLLNESAYNVGQIAVRLGYENAESFMKMFKRVSGQTPSEYREST